MIEIAFFGRGGQGAVTAVQILAQAAFLEGYYAQAFPKFGIERRGAPVSAYVRIDDQPIRIRSKLKDFDFAIVGDLMAVAPDVLFQEIKPAGAAIVNTAKGPEKLQPYATRVGRSEIRIYTIDATNLSFRVYGDTSIPQNCLGKSTLRHAALRLKPRAFLYSLGSVLILPRSYPVL